MKRLLIALTAALLPIAASPASAHTVVRETNIAENAVLTAAPDEFVVEFSAATGLAAIALTNEHGGAIDIDYTPPRTMATRFTIPLPRLAPGRYTISWRTIARDGHAMGGAVHFSVSG